jgi:hypothetical protein
MEMDFAWHTRTEKLAVVDFWWRVQQGECCICQREMLPYHRDHTTNPMRASIEHLKPRREGGANTVGNVRLAHAHCNNALGGLWSINQVRKNSGLEPLSKEWALATGARKPPNTRDRRRARRSAPSVELIAETIKQDAKLRTPKIGVSWCAANTISLPRGVTLLPGFTDPSKRAPVARKMDAVETARWLMQQGIRGS